MKFVTLKMIAAHVGRTPQAVTRALKLAGKHPGRTPGVKGIRITTKEANQFIEHQWPGSQPLGAAKD